MTLTEKAKSESCEGVQLICLEAITPAGSELPLQPLRNELLQYRKAYGEEAPSP